MSEKQFELNFDAEPKKEEAPESKIIPYEETLRRPDESEDDFSHRQFALMQEIIDKGKIIGKRNFSKTPNKSSSNAKAPEPKEYITQKDDEYVKQAKIDQMHSRKDLDY